MIKLRTIEAMLERQARLAEIRERVADQATHAIGRRPTEIGAGPWITVSRQVGSGGTELARRVARALDWQVYDREILQSIAEHTHTRETVIAWMDEAPVGPVTDYLSRLLDPQLPGEMPFLQGMARVILGLARKGNAVIVGRGAHELLAPRNGLRVRVVAPLEQRAAALAQRDALRPNDARRAVNKHDQRQREFIGRAFGGSIDDPLRYDLVLNIGALTLETAIRTVLAAAYRIGLAAEAEHGVAREGTVAASRG